MSVIDEIAVERQRQQDGEGWTPEHDDAHVNGEIPAAGACYASHAALNDDTREEVAGHCPSNWPWDSRWWKPKDRRRDLVRAAALIVAEIERLDRATERAK